MRRPRLEPTDPCGIVYARLGLSHEDLPVPLALGALVWMWGQLTVASVGAELSPFRIAHGDRRRNARTDGWWPGRAGARVLADPPVRGTRERRRRVRRRNQGPLRRGADVHGEVPLSGVDRHLQEEVTRLAGRGRDGSAFEQIGALGSTQRVAANDVLSSHSLTGRCTSRRRRCRIGAGRRCRSHDETSGCVGRCCRGCSRWRSSAPGRRRRWREPR